MVEQKRHFFAKAVRLPLRLAVCRGVATGDRFDYFLPFPRIHSKPALRFYVGKQSTIYSKRTRVYEFPEGIFFQSKSYPSRKCSPLGRCNVCHGLPGLAGLGWSRTSEGSKTAWV